MKLTAGCFWIIPAMFLGCSHAPCLSAQSKGSVCLAPGAFDTFAEGAATVEQYDAHERREREKHGSGAQPEAVRFVQVDRLPPVSVTSLRPGNVTGISPIGKHVIVVSKRIDMRDRVASFTFTFSAQGSNALCLWYGSFYASWMLQALKGSVCRCK
jgi:hypothetical protein